MNKILSQAIKKAVSEYNPSNVDVAKEKRADLFSLSDQTELFQNSKGITIKIDRTRDSNLTDFGRATLPLVATYASENLDFSDAIILLIVLLSICFKFMIIYIIFLFLS